MRNARCYVKKNKINQVRANFTQSSAVSNDIIDYSSLGRSCLSASLIHLAAFEIGQTFDTEDVDNLVIAGKFAASKTIQSIKPSLNNLPFRSQSGFPP